MAAAEKAMKLAAWLMASAAAWDSKTDDDAWFAGSATT
jgi:hypothetical protein